MSNSIVETVVFNVNQFMIDTLSKYLNREATTDDFARCRKVYHEGDLSGTGYDLFYENDCFLKVVTRGNGVQIIPFQDFNK